jgi:hypothetical protein
LRRRVSWPAAATGRTIAGGLRISSLDTIELIPGQTKFVVAGYTPGLYTAPDGSIAIAITRILPPGFAPANWLPVDENHFNVMLRVYGPKDNTDPDNPPYVPPSIDLVN